MVTTSTRAEAKAARREQLLEVAKTLYARHGFHGVRLDDLGKGAGISAPAVYRHFSSKEAVLEELLVGISAYLQSGGEEIVSAACDTDTGISPTEAALTLRRLIDFHVDFAMSEPELIRIQDRDLAHLPDAARRQVRRSQRQYVEIWVAVLTQLTPDLAEEDARVMAHAVFGLLNSTPYSARPAVPKAHSRALLRRMTLAALTAS